MSAEQLGSQMIVIRFAGHSHCNRRQCGKMGQPSARFHRAEMVVFRELAELIERFVRPIGRVRQVGKHLQAIDQRGRRRPGSREFLRRRRGRWRDGTSKRIRLILLRLNRILRPHRQGVVGTNRTHRGCFVQSARLLRGAISEPSCKRSQLLRRQLAHVVSDTAEQGGDVGTWHRCAYLVGRLRSRRRWRHQLGKQIGVTWFALRRIADGRLRFRGAKRELIVSVGAALARVIRRRGRVRRLEALDFVVGGPFDDGSLRRMRDRAAPHRFRLLRRQVARLPIEWDRQTEQQQANQRAHRRPTASLPTDFHIPLSSMRDVISDARQSRHPSMCRHRFRHCPWPARTTRLKSSLSDRIGSLGRSLKMSSPESAESSASRFDCAGKNYLIVKAQREGAAHGPRPRGGVAIKFVGPRLGLVEWTAADFEPWPYETLTSIFFGCDSGRLVIVT